VARYDIAAVIGDDQERRQAVFVVHRDGRRPSAANRLSDISFIGAQACAKTTGW
jgi:hypothetical protein